MATQSEIELDLDDDFAAVVARATRNLSVEAIRDILRRAEPGEVPCCRRIASNVLLVRRWAARPQRPGEHWSHRDTLELIDAELERMAIPAGERRGCGRHDCVVCNPPPAHSSCGGSSCAVPAEPSA